MFPGIYTSLISSFIFFISAPIFSQSSSIVSKLEDWSIKMNEIEKDWQDRKIIFDSFNITVKNLIDHNDFHYLEKLEYIIFLESGDVKVLSYDVQINKQSTAYMGFIIFGDKVYELGNVMEPLVQLSEEVTYTQKDWYGCLYYRLLLKEKQGKSSYFLLGKRKLKGQSVEKLLEPVSFGPDGILFGNLHAFADSLQRSRFIVMYHSEAAVSLNIHESEDEIYYDHTIPFAQEGELIRVPDGSYGRLVWKNYKWYGQDKLEVKVLSKPPIPKPTKDDEPRDIFGRKI